MMPALHDTGGAEMWARLPIDGAWESWVGLRRSLSGLYCSSLDGMDKTRYVEALSKGGTVINVVSIEEWHVRIPI